MTAWACPACGSTDAGEREGRNQFCSDCLRARGIYRTTQSNLRSGFNRTNKGSPSVDFSIDEFCVWRKAQQLRCHYCGISEAALTVVGMKSQIQRPVKVLGVDRLDSSAGYVLHNLVPCCFVCNQIKGDRFTDDEMRVVGPAVGLVWERRLAGELPVEQFAAATDESADKDAVD